MTAKSANRVARTSPRHLSRPSWAGFFWAGYQKINFAFALFRSDSSSDTHWFVDWCLSSVTIVSLVLKDDLSGTQAGAGFVSTRISNIQ